MKQKPSSRRRRSSTKSVLRLPDLERAKAAVLNSLNSAGAKRGTDLGHLDILGEVAYFHLECLLKNRQIASSCCRALWTC